jgi:hypothetical protein
MKFEDLLKQIKSNDPRLTELRLDEKLEGFSLSREQIGQLSEALGSNQCIQKIVVMGKELKSGPNQQRDPRSAMLDRVVTFLILHVQRTHAIRELTFSACNVSARCLNQLSGALTGDQTMKALILNGETLSTDSLSLLLNQLKPHPALQTLNLDDCQFGSPAGRVIADYLTVNNKLLTLSMHGQQLDSVDLTHLADALRTNSSLLAVRLANPRHPRQLQSVAESFTNALSVNERLQELDLGVNDTLLQQHLTVNKFIVRALNRNHQFYAICEAWFLGDQPQAPTLDSVKLQGIKDYLKNLNQTLREFETEYNVLSQKNLYLNKFKYAKTQLAQAFSQLVYSPARREIQPRELIALGLDFISDDQKILTMVLQMLDEHCISFSALFRQPKLFFSKLIMAVSIYGGNFSALPLASQKLVIQHLSEITGTITRSSLTNNQQDILGMIEDFKLFMANNKTIRLEVNELRQMYIIFLNEAPEEVLTQALALFRQEFERSINTKVDAPRAPEHITQPVRFFAPSYEDNDHSLKELAMWLTKQHAQGLLMTMETSRMGGSQTLTLHIAQMKTTVPARKANVPERPEASGHEERLAVFFNLVSLLPPCFAEKLIDPVLCTMKITTMNGAAMAKLIETLTTSGCITGQKEAKSHALPPPKKT